MTTAEIEALRTLFTKTVRMTDKLASLTHALYTHSQPSNRSGRDYGQVMRIHNASDLVNSACQILNVTGKILSGVIIEAETEDSHA